jgi:hypothetical protein
LAGVAGGDNAGHAFASFMARPWRMRHQRPREPPPMTIRSTPPKKAAVPRADGYRRSQRDRMDAAAK